MENNFWQENFSLYSFNVVEQASSYITVRPLFKTLHNTVKHMNLPTVV